MNQPHPTTEELVDYQHGELLPGDDAAVHEHLAQCETCAQNHDGEVQLSEMLRQYARASEREMPPGLIARIHAAVEGEPAPSWWIRLGAAFRPAIALPVAAAIAAALYFGVGALRSGSRLPAIDAAYYLEDHTALATATPFGDDSALPVALTNDDPATDERAVDAAH